MNICPVCEKGVLQEAVSTETIHWMGADIEVKGLKIARCNFCREEVVLPEQARANDAQYAKAKASNRVSTGILYVGMAVCALLAGALTSLLLQAIFGA